MNLTLKMSASYVTEPANRVRVARVAVIGAGVSGAFFADALKNRSSGALKIDVYESSDRIGGRTLDTSWLGDPRNTSVELGASMFIAQNRLVAEAAASLGLATQCRADATRGRGRLLLLGADGRPAFTEAGSAARSAYRMVQRFGLRGMRRLRALGRDFIANFSRIYDAIDSGRSFDSPRSLLAHIAMDRWPERSCEAAMAELLGSATHPAATELVSALVLNNYGQPWAVTGALCCFTAVAPLAAGGSAAAFHISGGNAQLSEGLFARSAASMHLSTTVAAVTVDETDASGEFTLNLIGAGGKFERRYDHVVLAAPCPTRASRGVEASIEEDESEDEAAQLLRRCTPLPYQEVHVSLVYGLIEPQALGSALSVAELNLYFADVLVAHGKGEHGEGEHGEHALPFNSIGRAAGTHLGASEVATCRPWAEAVPELPRWKFFSRAALTDAQIRSVMLCHDGPGAVRHVWAQPGAYPLSRPWPETASQQAAEPDEMIEEEEGEACLKESPAVGESTFVLHETPRGGLLLHPSSIEAATSAMEVVAVAATNAALLLHERLERERPIE